jgi:hypothetical protein
VEEEILMKRQGFATLVAVLGLVWPATALELKNGRAAYSFLSVPRADNKFLPGDLLIYCYDIDDLTVDEKTGVAVVEQSFEVLDKSQKIVFKQDPVDTEVPLFGARHMPSYVRLVMTADQPPGRYTLRLRVTDKKARDKSRASQMLTYDFDLLKPGFGIVQPFTPAVAFQHQDFVVSFAVTGMKRDDKKLPDVELSLRLLDRATGQPLVAEPVVSKLRDLHHEQAFDLTRMPVVPLSLPLVLSRPGEFLIEVKAVDRLAGKQEAVLRLPLIVVNPAPYLNRLSAGPQTAPPGATGQ